MAKNKKTVDRTREDLRHELDEQLLMLRTACRAYDEQSEAFGKQIAASLRMLLHHRGQSRALLDQLGLRNGRFEDTAGVIKPGNLLADFPLLVIEGGKVNGKPFGRYIPSVWSGQDRQPMRNKPRAFHLWWTEPVLKDMKGRRFSRMELVLHVADTDGGAHVDPRIDEAYAELIRGDSLGWSSGGKPLEGRPAMATMRQIAHEVLLTLHPRIGECAAPVWPAKDLVFQKTE